MNNHLSPILAFLAISMLPACTHDTSPGAGGPGDGAKAHADEGAHGGELVELGTAAHLEFVRKEATGEVTLYITGPDGKAPLAIADAPEIKLATDAGPKVITTTAAKGADGKASEFTAKDDALKAHEVAGRVSVKVGGKLFNPEIHEVHEHK